MFQFPKTPFNIKGNDEFSSLFKLNFTPPGELSPGISTNLSLEFVPRYNARVSAALHFLTKTGSFEVQIECYPKIVQIQIEPLSVFDLGTITLGEETSGFLTLRNSGALSANFSLSLEQSSIQPGFMNLEEADESIVRFSLKRGVLTGYTSQRIKVEFHPQRSCQVAFNLRFKFTSPDYHFEPFQEELPFTASVLDLPLFLEKTKIDFGVCFYDEVYRNEVIAHNRSSLSLKFQIVTPPLLDKYIDFTPKNGFVQALSSLHITSKVRILSTFLQDFPDFKGEIPLHILSSTQKLPVEFSVTFSTSSTRLIFDPNFIDFGTILNNECKIIDFKITSKLTVPTNFCFAKIPQSLSISPFDGFGLLLPNETVELKLRFQSTLIKKHDFDFQIATLVGSKFKLKGTCTVQASPLLFEATNILFEATSLGEYSQQTFRITSLKQSPCTLR